MIETFDEVIYVDWNSPERSLIEEIRPNLPTTKRLKHITVSPSEAAALLSPHLDAQDCCEVLGRNIGIRRATGDIVVSTNIDIISPSRETLQHFLQSRAFNPHRFITVARRDIPRDDVTHFSINNIGALQTHLAANQQLYPQKQQIGWRHKVRLDKISHRMAYHCIIPCCGDFQIAHRSVWNDIRGFEESMFRRLSTDTFVQKKARQSGYQVRANFELPVFHIEHGSGDGGKGTGRPTNDTNHYFKFSVRGHNPPNWGFGDRDIPVETI